MSGLVGYGSSDEEEEENEAPVKQTGPPVASKVEPPNEDKQSINPSPEHNTDGKKTTHGSKPTQSIQDQRRAFQTEPDNSHSAPAETTSNGTVIEKEHPLGADPGTTLRNLTMPTVPNLDIPGSPPGSPPTIMTEKVSRFLELKQQGIHFNEKLASSSSLKNPSLLGKLSAFAGLVPEDQYATSLPTELWNPQGFPSWAYKDQLAKAQEQAVKIHEEQKAQGLRPGVEFVKAGNEEIYPDMDSTNAHRGSLQHKVRHDGNSRFDSRSRSVSKNKGER